MKNKSNFLMSLFFNGYLAQLTLVFTIMVFSHSYVHWKENIWTFPELWHLITWGVVLVVILILRIVKHLKK